MKRWLLLLFVICLLSVSGATQRPSSSTANDPIADTSRSLCSPAQAEHPAIAYINGRWFDGTGFRQGTLYVVNGKLTTRRPAQIAETIDLKDAFVIPPLGDAHQHIFNSREQIVEDVRSFLRRGVFYVMVQDAIGEVASDVLARVNIPTSVDVVYTWAPLLGPGHGLLDYFKSLGEKGQFGDAKTLDELDTLAFFLLEDKSDVARKWNKIARMKTDFIKVILAFSEEHGPRRQNQRFYTDSSLQMARPGVPPELLPLIVNRAHRAGRRVSVHVETANDFRVAVNGAEIIAHLPGWHIGPTAGFADESRSLENQRSRCPISGDKARSRYHHYLSEALS